MKFYRELPPHILRFSKIILSVDVEPTVRRRGFSRRRVFRIAGAEG
jgi:hypothetical protein